MVNDDTKTRARGRHHPARRRGSGFSREAGLRTVLCLCDGFRFRVWITKNKSMLIFKLVDIGFLIWLLIGWRLCCQPIRSQVWKCLLANTDFDIRHPYQYSPLIYCSLYGRDIRLRWILLQHDPIQRSFAYRAAMKKRQARCYRLHFVRCKFIWLIILPMIVLQGIRSGPI